MIQSDKISRGNGVISKFVGMSTTRVKDTYDTTSEEILRDFTCGSIPFDEARFHSSWEWLMPVIIKINREISDWWNIDWLKTTVSDNKDGCVITIDRDSVRLVYCSVLLKRPTIKRCKRTYNYIDQSEIEAAWLAVVDAICLHNEFLRDVKNFSNFNYMDLRVKYKLSTGHYPTYLADGEGNGLLRGENVTGKYGQWLEENFYDGNEEEFLRREYMKLSAHVKYPVSSNKTKMSWTYDRNYVLWLEEYVIESKLFNFDS